MTIKWDKHSLKEYFCKLIDDLDGEEFTLDGAYGWCYIKAEIQKVEKE